MQEGPVIEVVPLFPFQQSLHPRHVGTPGTLDVLSYASSPFFLSFFSIMSRVSSSSKGMASDCGGGDGGGGLTLSGA